MSAFQRGAGKKRFKSEVAKDLPDVRGKEVAAFWYRTLKDYYFLKDPDVLHAHACQFTQMVWASTERFGCGKARTSSGKVLAVAHYSPKGNVRGQFKQNVRIPVGPLDDDSISSSGSSKGSTTTSSSKSSFWSGVARRWSSALKPEGTAGERRSTLKNEE